LKLHVISFGQSGYYNEIARDICKRIKSRYPKSEYRVYSELDLAPDYIEYASVYKRGFGYWRWKPTIILYQMSLINDGDLILYIDGRTHFKASRIEWLDDFISHNQYDVGVWQINHKESHYTTKRVFDHFGVYEDDILNGYQFAATFLLIRKNTKTTNLIIEWKKNLDDYKHLFRDDDNKSENLPGFVENRHDQSALSLLLKIMDLNCFIITDDRVYSKQSVIPQFKSSNDKFVGFIGNFLKIYLNNQFYRIVLSFYLNVKRYVKKWTSHKTK
jgi:hypothetical protein